jgi:hypothetical protein
MPRRLRRPAFSSVIAIAVVVALSGCAATRPTLEQINITNASGVVQPAVVAVTHGASIYLDAIVANDPEFLGVDWTVTCSSSLPEGSLPAGTIDTSCGSFTPYHTTSGPVPSYTLPEGVTIVTQYTASQNVPKAGTITIVAHATGLPSSTSSLTLTVL